MSDETEIPEEEAGGENGGGGNEPPVRFDPGEEGVAPINIAGWNRLA